MDENPVAVGGAFRPFTCGKCRACSVGGRLTQAGVDRVTLRREQHIVYYPDLITLLRAVKAIGAHNVGAGARRGMMGRAAWQKLEAAYEQQRQAAGLPASYDVILGYASK